MGREPRGWSDAERARERDAGCPDRGPEAQVSYDDWRTRDDRELGGLPPRTPEQTFRHNWTFVKRKGDAAIVDFLTYYGQFEYFRALVDEAREEWAEQRAEALAKANG